MQQGSAGLQDVLGVGWRRAKDWITSPDLDYARKKNGATP